ncbi:hypothetical protein BaRGS_00020302 [Batillaria attramentaria]|uniref:Secreted protein n=1 Tax=Batillaria attramentaria TaxID=370345 RepID=A0ABD0KNM3_9CAEN
MKKSAKLKLKMKAVTAAAAMANVCLLSQSPFYLIRNADLISVYSAVFPYPPHCSQGVLIFIQPLFGPSVDTICFQKLCGIAKHAFI